MTDSFFEEHFAQSPQPNHVPFALQKAERLVLIGDSIIEANHYSPLLETDLAVCAPGLEVAVRNQGKGGETADGFLRVSSASVWPTNPPLPRSAKA